MNKKWKKSIKDGAAVFKNCMVRFLKDQEEMIITAGITSGFILLCKLLKVPVNIDPYESTIGVRTNRLSDFDLGYPDNPVKVAAKSIMDDALTMTWDSEKVNAAIKIKNLVKDKELDEDTVSYIVKVLSKIGKSMTWDSEKNHVTNIITSIVKEN